MERRAHAHIVAVDPARDAPARNFDHVVHDGHGVQAASRCGLKRASDAMRRFRFERAGVLEGRVIALPAHHGGASLGEGAGLVEQHGRDVPQTLEGVGGLHEDAGAGGAHERDRHGERHGEPERARARDDEQRNHARHRHLGAELRPADADGGERHDEQHLHEAAGQHVGRLQQRGFARERVLHDGEQRADARLGAGGVHAHEQARAEVRGAGIHAVAVAHRERRRFPGEHRVVERRASREHDAVHRDEFAAADLHDIAGHERRERHFDHRGLGALTVHPARELEEGDAAQAVGAFEGGPLRAALELTGAEERRHEHRERVEPERSAAGHRIPGAGGRGDGEGDRNRQVDVDDAGAQAGDGRLEERLRREEEDRQRHDQREPAEERLVGRGHAGVLTGVERARDEHQVHRAGRGHAQPRQSGPVFGPAGILQARGLMHVRRVAQAIERAADRRQPRVRRPPRDLGHGAAVVQAHFVHAREHGRQLLHEPDAGGAVHAFEVEPRAAALAAQIVGGRRLHARVVEVVEAAAGDRGRFERALLLADEAVVLIEAPLAHERVDLPAARAAELLGLRLAHEGERHRLPAVRAGGGRGRRAAGGDGRHREATSVTGAMLRRAACTKWRACCTASRRKSHAPGASTRMSVR